MLGPIFRIEMLTSARRARHFLVRVVYALVLLVALWVVYVSNIAWSRALGLQEIANVAAEYFRVFAVLQVLAVLLVGPAVAAGTVAVERERRTIEYLFATDLSNAEIIVGKLVARTLQVTWYLLTGLPVLAIVMLLGGIGPEQLAIVFLLTVTTLLSVNVLSVAVSVWAPRVRDAFRRVYFLLFVLVLLPLILWPIASRAVGLTSPLAMLLDALVALNPVSLAFHSLVGVGFWTGGSPWPAVWVFVAGHLAAAGCLAVVAVWAVRRIHLAGDGKPARAAKARPRRTRRGPGDHPMLWKELLAARSGNRLGWAGKVLVAVAAIGCLTPSLYAASWQNPRDTGFVTIAMSTLLACAALLMLGARAASAITGEKERDTWVTLLSTPLEGPEILWGKFVGTLATLRGALVLLAIVWVVQLYVQPPFAIGVAIALVVIAVVAAAVVCLGLAVSLRARNTTRATGLTLFTLILVGGAYMFCCLPLLWHGPDNELVLSLVVPALIAMPQALVLESLYNSGFHDSRMVTVCVLGTIAYGVIAGLLWWTVTGGFEQAVGRTLPRGHRVPPSGEPTAEA